MLLGRICCRILKNVVVVENGINFGHVKVSKPVYSDSYFNGDIDDKL